MNIERIIHDVIRREGGYVNHPADRGGPTKYGITLATLQDSRGAAVTAADVEALGEEEAWDIFLRKYVIEPRFDQIADERLAALVVDSGVNHGPRRAAGWLQIAAGVKPDGKVGPRTLEAVNGQPPRVLFMGVLANRVRFYGELISRDKTQAVFAKGWANRVAEFMAVAA